MLTPAALPNLCARQAQADTQELDAKDARKQHCDNRAS